MSASVRASAKSRRPVDLEALLTLAAAHYAAGRSAEAERAYVEAADAAPGDARPLYSLAIIDIRLRRLASAARRLARVIRIDPSLAAAHHNLGYVHQQLGHWREATIAYARAADLDPGAGGSRLALAIALAACGRIDEAIEQYRRLAADPDRGADALTRLALLAPGRVTDAEAADLRRLAVAPAADDDALIGPMFALAGVLDARGSVDEAFDAYVQGNRLKHEALVRAGVEPATAAAHNRRAAQVVQTRLTADYVVVNRSQGPSKAAPIFIVGFPRSGSTLLEQILASHAQVRALGESSVLANLLRDRHPYSEERPAPGHFRELAEAYLAAQRDRGWDGRSRLVDKTLENYLHVGLIALMFPRAGILHSLRDPVDTSFACFRQLFVAGNETLYDLREIGEEYVRYRGVMNHWDQVLPGRVTPVSHEALVADPEAKIRWLVTEACGLPWDPACLRFEQSTRGVTTASGAQVRQPVFTTSLGRWRPYEKHLGPLLDALGPYAPRDARNS